MMNCMLIDLVGGCWLYRNTREVLSESEVAKDFFECFWSFASDWREEKRSDRLAREIRIYTPTLGYDLAMRSGPK